MKTNHLVIGIVVVLVIVLGAYFAGRDSNDTTRSVNIPSTLNTNNEPVSNTVQQKPANVVNNLTTESANGFACKNIASESAKANQARTNRLTSVLKSHFSLKFNQCYYELFSSISLSNSGIAYGTSTETIIRFAPDDDWIAYCSYDTNGSFPICNEHNHQGLETEQQFNQIEDLYLTN